MNPKIAISFWKQLAVKMSTATSGIWNLHNIYCGIPEITAETSEAFIPQMVNLEIIGGVNFQKGCYPGQEVVARTHYLGKPNRRMYRVEISDTDAVIPGVNIFVKDDEIQPVGKVVTAQKISESSLTALVVLRTEKENEENLHLRSISGPNITLSTLPYPIN